MPDEWSCFWGVVEAACLQHCFYATDSKCYILRFARLECRDLQGGVEEARTFPADRCEGVSSTIPLTFKAGIAPTSRLLPTE